MKKNINVLITGAGSSIGQGIYKSLKKLKIKKTIFLADVTNLSAGFYFGEKPIIIPKVETKGSLKKIISIISKFKIDLILIGSEYEIEFFAKNKGYIEKKTKAKVCCLDINIIKVANDKFKTYLFCKNNKINTPYTILASDFKKTEKYNFPLIAKPRKGTSGKGIHLIKDIREAQEIKRKFKNKFLLQEYIKPKEKLNEYTASIFVDTKKNILKPFVLKRKLKYGMSWITENYNDVKLDKIIKNIAKKLNITGLLNLQFLKKANKFYLLEINARFSSSTFLRTLYGYNEAKIYLFDKIFNKKLKEQEIRKGTAIRYVSEIYIEKKIKT